MTGEITMVGPGPGDDWPGQPYEHPPLPDGASWGHRPAHHDGSYVYPGRAVLELPGHTWPEAPEGCRGGQFETDWITPEVLVCR